MNRKSFFRTIGLVSAGALLPKTALKAAKAQSGVVCNLIPTENNHTLFAATPSRRKTIHTRPARQKSSQNNQTKPKGRQATNTLNLSEMRLPTSNYVYQMEVKNQNGIYTEYKLMTATGQ